MGITAARDVSSCVSMSLTLRHVLAKNRIIVILRAPALRRFRQGVMVTDSAGNPYTREQNPYTLSRRGRELVFSATCAADQHTLVVSILLPAAPRFRYDCVVTEVAEGQSLTYSIQN